MKKKKKKKSKKEEEEKKGEERLNSAKTMSFSGRHNDECFSNSGSYKGQNGGTFHISRVVKSLTP